VSTPLFSSNIEVNFCDTVINFFELSNRAIINCAMTDTAILHKHIYYGMHFGVEGERPINCLNQQELILKKNTMLVIAPGEYHYSMPSDVGLGTIVLKMTIRKTVHSEHIYDTLVERLNKLNLQVHPIGSDLIQSTLALTRARSKSPEDSCLLKTLAYKMVYDLLKELRITPTIAEDTSQSSSAMDLIALEELINTGRYTFKEIADLLGYSTKQTYRMILKIYGIPFRELRKRRMLEVAKKLLHDAPGMSVSDVARIAGFKTTTSFHKAFREAEGCTPAKYREKN